MQAKLHIRNGLAVLLVSTMISGSGCATGRQSKGASASARNFAPSDPPAASVAADSARLSAIPDGGTNANYANPNYANPSDAVPAAATDSSEPRSTRSSYTSGESSGGACGSSGCSRCGG